MVETGLVLKTALNRHGDSSAQLYSFIHPKYLLNVYFVFSTEDTAVTKTDMVPDPHGAHSLVERRT